MRRNQGFTITELMIAVVIIGVLATLAIPTFTSYIYKGRVTEAVNFLAEIKQRQESYRSEFGQYCAVDTDAWGSYNPSTIPGIDDIPGVRRAFGSRDRSLRQARNDRSQGRVSR